MSDLQLPPGLLFAGRYRIVRLIRAGGMGAVYEAVDSEERTGRRVALKVMRPEIVADADARRRFMLEARVATMIESSNVVYVIDAGVDDARQMPYLCMELLHGKELGDLVRERGRLPPHEAVDYLAQVARALDRAHGKNIVHRDLKPENLFLAMAEDEPPKVKVLDFGIAKVLEQHTEANATRAAGTPLYMAPEQTQRSVNVGPATDVWALGLVAYTLLVGRPYWESVDDSGAVNMNHLFREVLVAPMESPSQRAARRGVSLPHAFDAWFFSCVERDPTRRVQRASQAVAALAAALGVQSGQPGYGSRTPSHNELTSTMPMHPSGELVAYAPSPQPQQGPNATVRVLDMQAPIARDLPPGPPMANPAIAATAYNPNAPNATGPGVSHVTIPSAPGSNRDGGGGSRAPVFVGVALLAVMIVGGVTWAVWPSTPPAPTASPISLGDDDEDDAAPMPPKKKHALANTEDKGSLADAITASNPFVSVGDVEISKHEVTRGEYAKFLAALDGDHAALRPLNWKGDADFDDAIPVTRVTWEGASAFCAALAAHVPTNDEYGKAIGDASFAAAPFNAGALLPVDDEGASDKTAQGVLGLGSNAQEWTSSPMEADPSTMAIRGGSITMDAPTAATWTSNVMGGKLKAATGAKGDAISGDYLGFRCAR